jgi:hydrogenase assembly chaperone HypC/HupF
MCLVAPARVISIDGQAAVVDHDGRHRRASLLLEPETHVGDWVIVGSGTVLRRLDPFEAAEILETLRVAAGGDASTRGGVR